MTWPAKAYLVFPLISAMLFALSALAMKAGTAKHSDIAYSTLLANVSAAIGFTIFIDFKATPFIPDPLWPCVLLGGIFFLGQICTVLAIAYGAVSIATPVMSSKVVMVAFIVAFHLQVPLGWPTWVAGVLVMAGIACMQSGGEARDARSVYAAIFFALLAALSYAVFDVMTQVFSQSLGFERVVPFSMIFCMLFSLPLIPFMKPGAFRRPPAGMLLLSVALLTLQSLILITAIGKSGDAANCNIVYSSRGIFSVAFTWLFGAWFSVAEVQGHPGLALRRLGGAGIILVAIVLVLI